MYLLFYVDDILLANSSKIEIIRLKNFLKSEFDMKNLGNAKKILGMIMKGNRHENKLTVT